VVIPVPQPISKTLKEPGCFLTSAGNPATKPPTRLLIAAAAGQIRSSIWYSVPIGPENRRSAWLVDRFGSGMKACWVTGDLPTKIFASGRCRTFRGNGLDHIGWPLGAGASSLGAVSSGSTMKWIGTLCNFSNTSVPSTIESSIKGLLIFLNRN
jgi:hypothetical protein